MGRGGAGQRGAGAVAHALADAGAAGDGDDVLQRAAQLGPGGVGGAVEPQRPGGELVLQRLARGLVPAGERERGGQVAGDVVGKTGSGEDRGDGLGLGMGDDAGGPGQLGQIDALAAGHQPLPGERRGDARQQLVQRLHRHRQ